MNTLIITNDFSKLIRELDYDASFVREEIKMEDVAEIKREAYIKEKHKKTILIASSKFNVYAQNALLKILEESPPNVEFILVCDSKYKLLDTVVSRLVVKKRFFEKEENKIEIDKITNKFIFENLKKDMDKEEVKKIIKSLVKKAKNEEELKILNDAFLMIELNMDLKSVLAVVMLAFKERK